VSAADGRQWDNAPRIPEGCSGMRTPATRGLSRRRRFGVLGSMALLVQRRARVRRRGPAAVDVSALVAPHVFGAPHLDSPGGAT
jgi:hypothetical protein